MIDVGMRQHHAIDRLRGNRQRRPVTEPQVLEALEQAAVDQDTPTVHLEKMLGAGYRSRGPEKRQRCHVRIVETIQ
jgi:hypothetical protein